MDLIKINTENAFPILDCNNLTLSYDSGIAVNNVTFNLEPGDYLCIVGENGSGKSTLIKGLLGLMSAKSGSIKYNGLKQNEIGYLPQQTQVQRNFPASVYEVVISGCLNNRGLKPFYTKKEKTRCEENMRLLGIMDLKDKSYKELSGGQQQRVLLARALCATKRMLLLDEPMTGLDPIASNELYRIIKKLNKENGITVIMVTHDISCSLHDATKVLHMGKDMVFFGTADEYRKSEVSHNFLRCSCSNH